MSGTVRRVLVADDDASTRLLAQSTLTAAGFSVVLASNGLEAVEAALRERPDIILLDLEMPRLDGYGACERIRRLAGGADVPIVVATSLDDPPSVERAYASGATDFITKPLNWILLVHRVRYVLRAADATNELRAAESRNRTLLRAMPDSLFLLDGTGRITNCAAGEGVLPGDPLRRVAARSLAELLPPESGTEVAPACAEVLSARRPITLEVTRPQNGALQYLEVRLLPNEGESILAVVRDVSEARYAAESIHRLAYYDSLTDLPNRVRLEQQFTETLIHCAGLGQQVALLFIDLDHFRRVNETLGQLTGGDVLLEVADRLRAAVGALPEHEGQEPPVARVGADEYAVWLPVLHGHEQLQAFAETIRQVFEPVFGEHFPTPIELKVTASIGVALYPQHGQDFTTLLRNADAAAQAAKSAGRNRVAFYRAEMNERAKDRLTLETDLRRAVANGSLEVYYQPKYRVADLGLVGAEALLRWRHPQRGYIPPSEFIAIAEATGFIVDIDRWVVGRVCQDLADWRAAGQRLLPVAINLSAHEFLNHAVVDMLTDAAASVAIPHGLLELELTESALVRDAALARQLLGQLRDAGFSLAIDDFGTGYSSLQYLRSFPVHSLKIDRGFVQGAPEERDSCALIRAVIQFAHSLDLKVVAEGVETYRQLDFLRAENCDYLQGYLMDPALPLAAYTKML